MSTLFNTPPERHAFIIGLCEVLCPWPPRTWLNRKDHDAIQTEYHYYAAGRAVGFLVLLTLAAGIVKLF